MAAGWAPHLTGQRERAGRPGRDCFAAPAAGAAPRQEAQGAERRRRVRQPRVESSCADDGTTYAAAAETPKATHPARFTTAM